MTLITQSKYYQIADIFFVFNFRSFSSFNFFSSLLYIFMFHLFYTIYIIEQWTLFSCIGYWNECSKLSKVWFFFQCQDKRSLNETWNSTSEWKRQSWSNGIYFFSYVMPKIQWLITFYFDPDFVLFLFLKNLFQNFHIFKRIHYKINFQSYVRVCLNRL